MTRTTIKAIALSAGLLALAAGVSGIAPRAVASAPALDIAEAGLIIYRTSRPAFERRELEPDRRLGRFQLTYYWMAAERGRQPDVELYTSRCKRIARASRSFSSRLRLQGGGKLRDGRVLIYSGACSCPTSPCYRVARRSHTWGTGVDERPLSPFRSVAVDPSRVPIGTVLYIPELDGITMPGRSPYGGFVHDGCVMADDRGGNVRGNQIDFFAARRAYYKRLQKQHRLKKVTVFEGGAKCRRLAERIAVGPGAI